MSCHVDSVTSITLDIWNTATFLYKRDFNINGNNSPEPYCRIVRGLNLQKHHDCSHRSTSTNFGPGLDMTIIYQFLEGAKMGSLCGSHFGQIQDGRHPE